MKKTLITFIILIISVNIQAQITPKDILGINVNDSTNVLTIGSAEISKNTNIQKQAKTYSPGMEIQPHLPKSYNIDKSCAVGEIPVNTSSSPYGAMVMNIPFEIPQSYKDFGPQLGLSYTNTGGNGAVGIGWSIAGISQIARTNKSTYYDGKVEGVKFNTDAAFTLDGNRLILISSTSSSKTYQTEQGYVKVVGNLSGAGSYFTYFQVYYPDGNVAIYGYENEYSSIKNSYPLTKLTDKAGNTINYTYSYIDYHYRLSKVSYGQTQQASVEFSYSSSRSDIPKIYVGGYPISYSYLLSSVTTKFNGNIIRTYSLSYNTIANVSALSKIECSASGKKLNPIILYYGDNNQLKSYKKSNSEMTEWYNYTYAWQMRATKGKFDYGSENDGIITLPKKNPYIEHYRNPTMFRHSQNWIYNDYKGDESIFVTTGLTGKLSGWCPVLKTEAGFIDIFCADLDEFEGEEIIKVNNTISGSYDRIDFHVYTPNLFAGIAKKYTRTFNLNTLLDHRGDKSVNPKFYFTGDFIGNGKIQVLAIAASNAMGSGRSSVVYLFDLENNKILYQGSPFNYYVQYSGDNIEANTDKVYAVDYDGDGKTDLCLVDGGGLKLFTFNVSGSSYSVASVYTNSSPKKGDLVGRDFLPGDYNGDGKIDFLLSPVANAGHTWKLYTSEGDGWYRSLDIAIVSKFGNSRFFVQDMNGDGQTDLIENYNSTILATYFIADQKFIGSLSTSISSESLIIPSSINSYNYYSQLITVKNGIASRIGYQENLTKARLLTGMVNSLGTVTKFDYCQLNQDMLYSKGTGAQFPYKNFNGGYIVLNATESYNNNTKVGGSFYQYTNGIIHHQGLGFRGFERIYSNNTITGEYNITVYDPVNFGVIKSVESAKNQETCNYAINIASNKIVRSTISSRTEKDKLKNISVSYSYTYDAYDNPTKEIVDYGGGIKTTTTNTFTNHTSFSPYLLGELATQTVTKERSGSSSTTKVENTYNAKRLLVSSKRYSNNNLESEETYAYNTNGNITELKKKPYTSTNWFITRYEYDTYGRLTKETDPIGLYTVFAYDTKDNLGSTKNQKNLETKYEYDEFGREIKTTNPDGIIETTSLAWVSSPTNALIQKTLSVTGKPSSQIFVDALGREIRKGEMRFDGKYLYTDIGYDTKGRLQKVSLPFKGGSATKWNTYEYDGYDRLIALNYASGNKEKYSYKDNSITVTKDNIERTTTYDPVGSILSVKDPTGTITYSTRADGNPASIVAPGNITTSFEYDVYGRRTKIVDPSAGTVITAYDAAGNVSKYTDANNKVTQSSYDSYNRITKKEVVGELTTSYTYNSDGQLLKISNSNNTGRSFTYDAQMRISSEKESIVDNKWLEKSFVYANGVASSITYSANTGSIVTQNFSYANGHLTEIKLNNSTSIWKLTRENDLGGTTEATSGVLTRSYTYDVHGLPTARVIKKGSTTIMDFGYSIAPATGNLSWRKDNIRNIQENFSYDNMNRLTGFGGTTITYDLKGNITNISTVGLFSYNNSSKPYAITDVKPSGTAIPLRTQNVTYNGFRRPSAITEDIYSASFVYNEIRNRIKMQIKKNNTDDLTRYYIGGQYEIESGTAGTKEKLYLDGDAYTASAVYVKEGGGAWGVYYLGRDYLGSITHLIDATGNLKNEMSYDPWGRLRNPTNHQAYAPGAEPTLFLGRGYTGHEHLAMFGLINMNARLYDPALGRFLSPDPYVQDPFSSQNFNRYSYCWNNPLRYTDPDGEWIIFAAAIIGAYLGGSAANKNFNPIKWDYSSGSTWAGMIGGAIQGACTVVGLQAGFAQMGWSSLATFGRSASTANFLTGTIQVSNYSNIFAKAGMATVKTLSVLNSAMISFNAASTVTSAITHSGNAGDILMGNYYYNPRRTVLGQIWQGISRGSWESIQQNLGTGIGHLRNTFGDVDNVDFFDGATLINKENLSSRSKWGMTLGSMINSSNVRASIDDEMFMHEYGHTQQGMVFGPAYPFAIGIPSIFSAAFSSDESHSRRWYEKQANRYASRYFRRFYGID